MNPIVGAALIGAGSSLASNLFSRWNASTQNKRARSALGLEYDYNAQLYRNRYQWMAEDLERAGLNPILAISSGLSTGGSPSVGLPSISQAYPPTGLDFASTALSLSKAKEAEKSAALKEAQRKTELNNAKLVLNNSLLAIANTLKARQEAKTAKAKEAEIIQKIENLKQEYLNTVEKILKTKYEAELISRKAFKTSVETSKIAQMEMLINRQCTVEELKRKQLTYLLSELKRVSEVYEGKAGKPIAYLKQISSLLRIVVGAFR